MTGTKEVYLWTQKNCEHTQTSSGDVDLRHTYVLGLKAASFCWPTQKGQFDPVKVIDRLNHASLLPLSSIWQSQIVHHLLGNRFHSKPKQSYSPPGITCLPTLSAQTDWNPSWRYHRESLIGCDQELVSGARK